MDTQSAHEVVAVRELVDCRAEEKRQIIAAQAGDLNAFEALVRRHERKVLWIARSLVGNTEDSKDIAQETFLRVWQALPRFQVQFNFYTWLHRIVVNLSIDHLRKHGRLHRHALEEQEELLLASESPEGVAEQHELGERIQGVLNQLPAKYRMVLVLRDVQELSCAEISRIIQCTPANARWRLHRARTLFREAWNRIMATSP